MRDDTIILVLMLDNRRVTLFQGDEVTVDSLFFLFSLLLNFLNELAEELSEHCSHGGVYLIRVISRKLQIYDQS